jgi:hypothetical protein
MDRRKRLPLLMISIPAVLLLAAFTYYFPPVHTRLSWRVDELRTRIKYALNPPEAAVFVPQQLPPPAVRITQLPPTASLTPPPILPSPTPAGPTPTPTRTPTPTITPTPLPEQVTLAGVKYEHQHNRWNYCGPANLSMALTFWGWDGNRDVVGKYVKPKDKDKNVMPYELQDFVHTQTSGMEAQVRFGGEVELVKRLIAAGYPVLVEKGYYERDYTGKIGWMGHYQFVTAYDDGRGALTVQDTYIKDGKDHPVPYAEFIEGWRSFNYLFMLVYPVERGPEVMELLGSWADNNWATQHALEIAQSEALSLSGIDQFFAWFNIGTSHANLQQYFDSASAYDYAFGLYAALPDDGARPYRLLWYQTWPYWAYYYTGRYHDVINLADTTLNDTISEPVLEESFYWRALARQALGDTAGALADLQTSVRLNPNFGPGLEQLARLGVNPEN